MAVDHERLRELYGETGIEAARAQSPAKPALTHGACSGQPMAMLCDQCGIQRTCDLYGSRDDGRCTIEAGYLQWRRPYYYRVIEAHGHDPRLQEHVVEACLFAELRAERAMRWMRDRGDTIRVDGDDVPTGINKHFSRAIADVKILREQLGLTAAGMEKLEVQRQSAAADDFFGRLGAAKAPRVTALDVECEPLPPGPPPPGEANDASQAGEGGDGDGGLSPRPPLPGTANDAVLRDEGEDGDGDRSAQR